jgi:two-component system, OmpR family, KDP operon response regulator KdpE
MTPQPMRIMIVDDDSSIRQMLRLGLSHTGYSVFETTNGIGALEAVRRQEADLLLLDLGLPDLDGLEIIKRIRYAQSNIPIIILSHRGNETAKVTALDLGADDYVTKPFGMEELFARIRVLHRQRVQPSQDQSVVAVGSLKMNLVQRSVTVRGVHVHLSPREYSLLELFAVHAGKVLTHNFILSRVWGTETGVQYLRIYVRTLRRKIEPDPDRPSVLITEPGVGYRMTLPEPVETSVPPPSADLSETIAIR